MPESNNFPIKVFDLNDAASKAELNEFLKRAKSTVSQIKPVQFVEPDYQVLDKLLAFYHNFRYILSFHLEKENPFIKELFQYVDTYPIQSQNDLNLFKVDIDAKLTEMKEDIQYSEYTDKLIPDNITQIIYTTQSQDDFKKQFITVYDKNYLKKNLDLFALDMHRGFLIDGSKELNQKTFSGFSKKLQTSIIFFYRQVKLGQLSKIFATEGNSISRDCRFPNFYEGGFRDFICNLSNQKNYIEIQFSFCGLNDQKENKITAEFTFNIPKINIGTDEEDIDISELAIPRGNIQIWDAAYYNYLSAFYAYGYHCNARENTPLYSYVNNSPQLIIERNFVLNHLENLKVDLQLNDLIPVEKILLCLENVDITAKILNDNSLAMALFKDCTISNESNFTNDFSKNEKKRIDAYELSLRSETKLDKSYTNYRFKMLTIEELMKAFSNRYKDQPLVQTFIKVYELIRNNEWNILSKLYQVTQYRIAFNVFFAYFLPNIPKIFTKSIFLENLDSQTLTLMAERDERFAKSVLKCRWLDRFVSFLKRKPYQPPISRLNGDQIIRILNSHPKLKLPGKFSPINVWEKFSANNLYDLANLKLNERFLYRDKILKNKSLMHKLCECDDSLKIELLINLFEETKNIIMSDDKKFGELQQTAKKRHKLVHIFYNLYQHLLIEKVLQTLPILPDDKKNENEWVQLIKAHPEFKNKQHIVKAFLIDKPAWISHFYKNNVIQEEFKYDLDLISKLIETNPKAIMNNETLYKLYVYHANQNNLNWINMHILKNSEILRSLFQYIADIKSQEEIHHFKAILTKSPQELLNHLTVYPKTFLHLIMNLDKQFLLSRDFYKIISSDPKLAGLFNKLYLHNKVQLQSDTAIIKLTTNTNASDDFDFVTILSYDNKFKAFDVDKLQSWIEKCSELEVAALLLAVMQRFNESVNSVDAIAEQKKQLLDPIIHRISTSKREFRHLMKYLSVLLENKQYLLLKNVVDEVNLPLSLPHRKETNIDYDNMIRMMQNEIRHENFQEVVRAFSDHGNIASFMSYKKDTRREKIISQLESKLSKPALVELANLLLLSAYQNRQILNSHDLITFMTKHADPAFLMDYLIIIVSQFSKSPNFDHSHIHIWLSRMNELSLLSLDKLDELISLIGLTISKDEFKSNLNSQILKNLIPILSLNNVTPKMRWIINQLLPYADRQIFSELLKQLYTLSPKNSLIEHQVLSRFYEFKLDAEILTPEFFNSAQGNFCLRNSSDLFDRILASGKLKFLEYLTPETLHIFLNASYLKSQHISKMPFSNDLCLKIFDDTLNDNIRKHVFKNHKVFTFLLSCSKEFRSFAFQYFSTKKKLKDYEKDAFEYVKFRFDFKKSNKEIIKPKHYDIFELTDMYGMFKLHEKNIPDISVVNQKYNFAAILVK